MDKPDFMEGVVETVDSLAELKDRVDYSLQLTDEVAKLTEKLSEVKKVLRRVMEEDIPTLMLERGITKITLDTGETVTVKQDLSATILDKEGFFKFLDQHDAKDLVKLKLSMEKMPDRLMDVLFDFLDKNEYQYNAEKEVAAQTRLKFLRELCGIGLSDKELGVKLADGRCMPIDALPSDTIKAFVYYKTKIKK